jgi:hypothetical protein
MEVDFRNIGILIVVAGVVLALIIAAVVWWRERRSPFGAIVSRSADSGPPTGSVEWVVDIRKAMSNAPAETVLQALTDGVSRDEARYRRITELEGSGNG